MFERYYDLYDLVGKSIRNLIVLEKRDDEIQTIGIVAGTHPNFDLGEDEWKNLGYIILSADQGGEYDGDGSYHKYNHLSIMRDQDYNWEYQIGVISWEEYKKHERIEREESARRVKEVARVVRKKKIQEIQNDIDRGQKELAQLLELSGEN